VRYKKLITITRRTLEESDRELFTGEVGDLSIEEYKVITVSRYLKPNVSTHTLSQYLTCAGKLLKLYEAPQFGLTRYAKICIFYLYDEPWFYRRNSHIVYGDFSYDDLIDMERKLVIKMIAKIENDLIEDEERIMIMQTIESPAPQIIHPDEQTMLDDITNGILVGNGKGGFTIYNPK
jgi:hypothetical protein